MNIFEIVAIIIGVALIPAAAFAAHKIKITSPLSDHSNGVMMAFVFMPSILLIFLPLAINATTAQSENALREIRQAHPSWQHVDVDYANKIVKWEQGGKFCEAPLLNRDDHSQVSTNRLDTKCTL